MREVCMGDYANNLLSQTRWLRCYYRHIELWQTLCDNECKTRPRIQNCFGFLCVVLVSGKCFWIFFGFWEVFLDSGTCFVPTSHRPALAKLFLYFCCENFGLFSKTRSAAWLDCLYSRHWRQVFHNTLDGAGNTGLITTHSFYRNKERLIRKEKLPVSSL